MLSLNLLQSGFPLFILKENVFTVLDYVQRNQMFYDKISSVGRPVSSSEVQAFGLFVAASPCICPDLSLAGSSRGWLLSPASLSDSDLLPVKKTHDIP